MQLNFKPMLASQIDDLSSVKYFDQGGYDVPRFPIFKGIRNEMDFKE